MPYIKLPRVELICGLTCRIRFGSPSKLRLVITMESTALFLFFFFLGLQTVSKYSTIFSHIMICCIICIRINSLLEWHGLYCYVILYFEVSHVTWFDQTLISKVIFGKYKLRITVWLVINTDANI